VRRMREVRAEAWLPALPDNVWTLVTDHEGMSRWTPAREVVRRRPGSPHPDGPGAVRTVKGTGIAFDERIVDWKPGERMVYELLGGAPLRDHRGELHLAPEAGGTRLVWVVGFRPLVPGTGALLAGVVRRLLRRSLDGLRAEIGRRAP